GEKWAEFCVLRGGTLVLSRSLTAGANLAGEIRRNLMVYAGQSPGQPIQAVYLAGASEQPAVLERLRDFIEIPVHDFDPFGGDARPEFPSASRGSFAGVVGLLHLVAASPELPINFLQPRQPRPPRDPNRRMFALCAALGVVLLAGGFVLGNAMLDRSRERLAG